jgi:hypothetical protein
MLRVDCSCRWRSSLPSQLDEASVASECSPIALRTGTGLISDRHDSGQCGEPRVVIALSGFSVPQPMISTHGATPVCHLKQETLSENARGKKNELCDRTGASDTDERQDCGDPNAGTDSRATRELVVQFPSRHDGAAAARLGCDWCGGRGTRRPRDAAADGVAAGDATADDAVAGGVARRRAASGGEKS